MEFINGCHKLSIVLSIYLFIKPNKYSQMQEEYRLYSVIILFSDHDNDIQFVIILPSTPLMIVEN